METSIASRARQRPSNPGDEPSVLAAWESFLAEGRSSTLYVKTRRHGLLRDEGRR